MNDKIKELAEQALKYADMQSDFLCESENRDIETSETQTLAFEKFAELIVQECGVALSPMLRDMISRDQAYNLIKEHFRIK